MFKPNPKLIRLLFFWTGIIATIAYRVIIVLNFFSPLWVKISWYIGTIGFIIYFWHRYNIDKKRSQLVADYDLIKAVNRTNYTNEKQKQALHYIIKTTLTSKSKWNSFFIFMLSIFALIVGLILDFGNFMR